MAYRILIVDDDNAVSRLLVKIVKSIGYEADLAESGEEALIKIAGTDYALMLLDINLGGMDGFQVIETLRKKNSRLPIIVVSGRREDFDTMYGLDIGADEYITKPFNPVTLGAKIKALIRRCSTFNETDPVITAGPFAFNTSTLRFYKNGEEIVLTGKESAMMKLFLDNVNRVFTRNMLYDLVWGNDIVDDNAIMVYINRLRQKIEDDPENPRYIQTIRGVGYRFVIL